MLLNCKSGMGRAKKLEAVSEGRVSANHGLVSLRDLL